MIRTDSVENIRLFLFLLPGWGIRTLQVQSLRLTLDMKHTAKEIDAF
jgi:hypothetical protein